MGKARVLLLEPVGFLRWAFVKHLRAAGHVVEEAADSTEALHRADLASFHLALLDLEGLEAAREIKRRAPGCRVVVMAAHDASILRGQACEAGADDFLVKPGEVARIATAVDALIPGLGDQPR